MQRRSFLLATLLCAGGRAAAAPPAERVRGTFRRLTEPGAGDNRATFMPGGRTLVFASQRTGRSQLWFVDLGSHAVARAHESAANDFGRVAPDRSGRRLSFSSDRSGQNAVYVLDRHDGKVTAVSNPAFWSFGPSWSARDVIAYFSKEGGNALNIWTVRPDGSQRVQRTNQPGESRQPWWSADGERLAYSANQGTAAYAVYVERGAAGPVQRLTDAGSFEQPFWSPSGRWIAASATFDDLPQIVLIDVQSGALKTFDQPAAENVHPAWSPDGRHIVFTSGEGRHTALFLFTLQI